MEMPLSRTMSFEWKKAPSEVELTTGQVHIWKVLLDDTFSCETGSVLSAEELQRSLRLISPQKRARFQCAHVALREILSMYLDQAPENIQIGYGPLGKPFIMPSGMKASLEFNISHADDLMLAAFTTCGPVGIDLENYQSIQVIERIVASYFSARDLESFKDIPDEEKGDAFLSAWVRKEAYGKTLGSGLAAPPARNHFSQFTISRLSPQHYALSKEDDFHFLSFSPSPDFSAAAVIQTIQNPQFFFWETTLKG